MDNTLLMQARSLSFIPVPKSNAGIGLPILTGPEYQLLGALPDEETGSVFLFSP
jgi:hypothetical protein